MCGCVSAFYGHVSRTCQCIVEKDETLMTSLTDNSLILRALSFVNRETLSFGGVPLKPDVTFQDEVLQRRTGNTTDIQRSGFGSWTPQSKQENHCLEVWS